MGTSDMQMKNATFQGSFASLADSGSPFCLGVDPSSELLLRWGLPASIDGLRRFCDSVVEAAAGSVQICKPQVAFFEAFGAEGLYVLSDFIKRAQRAEMLVIADIKRGDVGHSSAAYAEAWIGRESPFGADAITVSPYMGFEALVPMFERAQKSGAVVFVVVRSSNREGERTQTALYRGTPVCEDLAERIRSFNTEFESDGIGPIGAVIGATLGGRERRTVERLSNSLFLIPGLGAQGGTFADIRNDFRGVIRRVIPTSSRAVLQHGPDIAALRKAIAENAEQARQLRNDE